MRQMSGGHIDTIHMPGAGSKEGYKDESNALTILTELILMSFPF